MSHHTSIWMYKGKNISHSKCVVLWNNNLHKFTWANILVYWDMAGVEKYMRQIKSPYKSCQFLANSYEATVGAIRCVISINLNFRRKKNNQTWNCLPSLLHYYSSLPLLFPSEIRLLMKFQTLLKTYDILNRTTEDCKITTRTFMDYF